MTDIRKRLGLDWTKKKSHMPSVQRSDRESEAYMQDAILAFAPKIMEVLAKSQDRTATMFYLVDELSESVRVLGPVLENLRDHGYVDFVSEDPKGNHKVRLTDRGLKVVS
jgi:hypothetical protein